MAISESLYNLTKSPYRKIKIRVDLLNFNFQVVGNLEGNAISGNVKIDANADIRRVADITLVVTDSSFDIGEDKKIWINKYIQIYVGMLDLSNNVEWTNMGIFLIDNPTRFYNANTHTLSFQAYDLMSKMTGLRNGQLEGVPTLIKSGSSISNTMASTVSQLGGFNNFIIDENPQDVPYDINIETGGYVFDIIEKLRDINPNWETFFDVDGIFHYQPISAYESDEVLIDDDLLNYVVTDISQNVDFENVKNVIEVFGKSLSPTRYGDVATRTNSLYTIELDDFSSLTPNLTIGFTTPADSEIIDEPYLEIVSNGSTIVSLPIIDENGNPQTIEDKDGEYLVVMNKTNLIDASEETPWTADYSATANIVDNSCVVSIPSLTTWQPNTKMNITIPSITIGHWKSGLLFPTWEAFTISGSEVPIPSAGEVCYIRITGSNSATFINPTSYKYNDENVTVSGLTYTLNGLSSQTLKVGDVIRFVSPYVGNFTNIQINGISMPICDSSGIILYDFIKKTNITYKLKISPDAGFFYLGHQQIHAVVSDNNPNSPFFIEKDIGEIRLVLKDGEYNNIYTDSLALQRANYELYLHCRMEDSIDLTLVPIYWLDVNKKIYFNEGGINATYIIKSIEIDLSPGGLMKLNAIKSYASMPSNNPAPF